MNFIFNCTETGATFETDGVFPAPLLDRLLSDLEQIRPVGHPPIPAEDLLREDRGR